MSSFIVFHDCLIRIPRFKYNLFLGLDANFRLKNKLRRTSKDKDYTVLGDGLGVFAPLYGDEGYIEHVKKYVSEQDVSTCGCTQKPVWLTTS